MRDTFLWLRTKIEPMFPVSEILIDTGLLEICDVHVFHTTGLLNCQEKVLNLFDTDSHYREPFRFSPKS